MAVNIDWKLVQNPNVMASYMQGLQLRNELGRQNSQMAARQAAPTGGQGMDEGGDGRDEADWREPASWDLLSGIEALRRHPVGSDGDTSARAQAASQMLPVLMQRYPRLNPQALQQIDLSDEGLTRAEQYLLGG